MTLTLLFPFYFIFIFLKITPCFGWNHWWWSLVVYPLNPASLLISVLPTHTTFTQRLWQFPWTFLQASGLFSAWLGPNMINGWELWFLARQTGEALGCWSGFHQSQTEKHNKSFGHSSLVYVWDMRPLWEMSPFYTPSNPCLPTPLEFKENVPFWKALYHWQGNKICGLPAPFKFQRTVKHR